MSNRLFRLVALGALVGVTACSNLSATKSATEPQNIVTVEGQAAVHNGAVLLAKKQALQDAIRVASQQSAVAVHSLSSMNKNRLLDSISMRSAAAVSNTKVLHEWEKDGIYHVKAMVELSPTGMCQPTYRKRLIATAFPRMVQEQISDYETNDLDNGIPREINNLLMESNQFIGINATHIALYPRPDLAPNFQERSEPFQQSKILQVASKTGAQFVLSGVIRDLEIASDEYMNGTGLSSFLNSWERHFSGKRNIGIDIYVHDGMSGALLMQRRYVDKVEGDVMIPASYSVGSDGFRSTPTGKKITEIISKVSQDIEQSLSCYPFTTRIIEIRGDKIFIDAGAQEKLNVGDQLIVYGTSTNDLHLDGGSSYIQSDKQPVSVLTIQSITPRYSIGTLEAPAGKLGVKVGDWVSNRSL